MMGHERAESSMPRVVSGVAFAGLLALWVPGSGAAVAPGDLSENEQIEDRWVAGGAGRAASTIQAGDSSRARGASSCDSAAPATPSEQRERDEIAVLTFAALFEAALPPPTEGCPPPGRPAVWCLASGPPPIDLEGVDPPPAVLDALAAKGYSVRGTQACGDLPSNQLWPRAAAGIECIPDPKGATRLRLEGWTNVFDYPPCADAASSSKRAAGIGP